MFDRIAAYNEAIDLRETLMNKVGEYGQVMFVGDHRAGNELFKEILRLSGQLRDVTKEG